MMVMRSYFQTVINGILIGLLVVPAPCFSQSHSQGSPGLQHTVEPLNKQHGITDASYLFSGRQVREEYEAQGDLDLLKSSIKLSDIDVSIQSVSFAPSDIKIFYEREENRLEFQRWVFDSKLKRMRKTHAHVIFDVKLNGNVDDLVQIDGNVVLAALEDGKIFGTHTPLFFSALFQAYIPLTPFYQTTFGIKQTTAFQITKLELTSPEKTPRSVSDNYSLNEVSKLDVNDLVITLVSEDKKESHVRFSYYDDISRRLRAHLLSVCLLLQAANPKDELIAPLQELISKENEKRQSQSDQNLESYIESSLDRETHLGLEVLRQTALKVDFAKLLNLFKTDQNSEDAFDRLRNSRRWSWNIDDWKALKQTIDESRNLENEVSHDSKISADKLRKSWSEIIANNWRNPSKNTKEYLEKEAHLKASMSTSFSSYLFDFARKEFSLSRLKFLGAAIAADTVNAYTDGAVTHGLFKALSTVLGWTTGTWGIGGITNETVKYGANYFEPIAFTSTVTLLGFLLSFQPLCYLLAKAISTIRNEKNPDGTKWSAAQSFFSYGGRMYAYLTYPIQIGLWKMLGQKNIVPAIVHGGGITTPGALTIPYLSSSSRSGIRKMNQHYSSGARKKDRSMLLAAIAASEFTAQRGQRIDPATLLMMMTAYEQGKIKDFTSMLQEAPPDLDWERITSLIYREMNWMTEDDLKEIDESIIGEYLRIVNKAINQIDEQYSQYDDGFIGCVSTGIDDACKWIKKSAKRFQVTTSSIASFVLTGGQSYLFFERNKNFVANETQTAVADEQFRHDYSFSMQVSAVTDSMRFPVALQVGEHADKLFAAIAEGGEQCGVYGAQGGVEQAMIQPLGSELVNPSPNIGAMVTKRNIARANGNHNSKEIGEVMEADASGIAGGRQATVWKSLKVLGKAALDPQKGLANLAYTQKRRMDATVQALQGKGLMGYIPRLAAMTIISLLIASESEAGLSSWDPNKLSKTAFDAFLRQTNVIFNKLSFVYGPAGIAIGYAVVWAYVIWSQNTLEFDAIAQRRRLEAVDHKFEQFLNSKQSSYLTEAVADLQVLYREGKIVQLPEEFTIDPKDFDEKLAQSFFDFSINNPPMETVISDKVSQFNNKAVGAFISSVIAVGLSHAMYDKDADIWLNLSTSLASFAGTYLGVTALAKHSPKIVEKIKSIYGGSNHHQGEACSNMIWVK